VREQAALAHAEVLGQAAEGQALEAVRGGDLGGAREDGVAGEGEEGTRRSLGRKKIERSVGLLQMTDRSCYYFL